MALWEISKGVRRRGGGGQALVASSLFGLSRLISQQGGPHQVIRQEGGLLSRAVSGASPAPRAVAEGQPATCVTHSGPDAARCEDAPELLPTLALVATLRETPEGVTGGGQSGNRDGLHAAEALTPSSPRQAVRGQGPKAGGASLTC